MKQNRAKEPMPAALGAIGERSEAHANAGSLVAWLVLALIIEQPSHGYELYQRYEARFGEFLSVSKSNVYAVLGRLRVAEMIEEIVLEPAGQPRKQHGMRHSYRATRAGAQAYRRWVAERMSDDPQRPQLLGRIASASLLGFDALLDVIDRYEKECLRTMMALPPADPENAPGDVAELVESLVVDQRRREMRARVDWAIYARRIVRTYLQRMAAERADES